MKIDIIIAVAERGGVENVINRTAAYLQQKKHTVRVVQMVWEGVEWVEQGVAHFPLLYGREGHSLEEFAEEYQGFLEREGMPEIILAAAWPYMSYVAKAAVLQKHARIPVVSWLHAPAERYQAAGYGGYESLWYADAHFAISGSIYNAICRHGGKQVYRIYNPVDFSGFAGTESEEAQREMGRLFYVGRISPEKHLEVIIKALAMTRQKWELSIVGTGEEPLERSLKQKAERLGVAERIKWLGWQEKPWKCAAVADAVVLASEYEGAPLTAIEALACGRTVISTPVEGVKELIVPGKTGYLFGFGDSGMLAEILDAMSDGVLVPMDTKACRAAVACYESGRALQDFEWKLQNCFECFKAYDCGEG